MVTIVLYILPQPTLNHTQHEIAMFPKAESQRKREGQCFRYVSRDGNTKGLNFFIVTRFRHVYGTET